MAETVTDADIERVAAAIYDANIPCKKAVPFAQLHPVSRRAYCTKARAAIAALFDRRPLDVAELVEALKLGLSVIETMWPLSGPDDEPESTSLQFINSANALLAKHEAKP